MQLSKIISLLLGILIASTSVNTFSAEKQNPSKPSHTQRKAITSTAKKAQNKGQKKTQISTITKQKKSTIVVSSATKKSVSHKKAQVHNNKERKKTNVKKITNKVPSLQKTKTTAKKNTTRHNINIIHNTKKQYGVNGAKLTHVKVINKTYRYREKNKTHTSIDKEKSRLFSQTGIASYYGGMFHGRKTASGEIFNKNAYTAAHKTLALGSYVLVTNLRNGRKVIVRINDRGPFSHNRIIDLSVQAAKEIGMHHTGIAKVKIEAMQVDRQGYISGKGAESLYKLAKNSGLLLKVKGSGKNFAIKAE
ncbi:hypothetical protein A6B43_04330 [Vespertiliibacter pulmonis]|uniref:Endolytic peptidoglycan transglycosylase RlpA n=1 Tax=Vespertiliibacter pulmonis TaxID=1443036 RepID=A0A3N4VK44_9PAST|nr:septal ring lytic transglycosylase RlpA family protein [Vespertiliibacter pulmonis]QLB20803.1 hypothetical protein A6B43_04330 [Vespertiliibacter pulmonis]RPE83452.1 rare lipoprotein A [Vespertiliibacter pulmonis]